MLQLSERTPNHPAAGGLVTRCMACGTQTGNRCLPVQATPVTLHGLARRLPVQRVAHGIWTRNTQADSTGETGHGSAFTVVSLRLYQKLGDKYRQVRF
jgi:hypothetical protein